MLVSLALGRRELPHGVIHFLLFACGVRRKPIGAAEGGKHRPLVRAHNVKSGDQHAKESVQTDAGEKGKEIGHGTTEGQRTDKRPNSNRRV
jgi:hypothetical protein